MHETFLTISETAKLLTLSEKSVYKLAQTGELPGAAKFGGQWRISRDELMAWVAAQGKATPTPTTPRTR